MVAPAWRRQRSSWSQLTGIFSSIPLRRLRREEAQTILLSANRRLSNIELTLINSLEDFSLLKISQRPRRKLLRSYHREYSLSARSMGRRVSICAVAITTWVSSLGRRIRYRRHEAFLPKSWASGKSLSRRRTCKILKIRCTLPLTSTIITRPSNTCRWSRISLKMNLALTIFSRLRLAWHSGSSASKQETMDLAWRTYRRRSWYSRTKDLLSIQSPGRLKTYLDCLIIWTTDKYYFYSINFIF